MAPEWHNVGVSIPLIKCKFVIADEQWCVEGLGQHCVDSDHDQQDGQLQNRVQSEEHCTRHHRQHSSKHEILSMNRQTTSPLIRHCSVNELILNSLHIC